MGSCICSTERLWHSVMHVKHLNCLSEDETHICMFLLESHNAKYNIEIVCCNTCNNQYVTNKYDFSFTIMSIWINKFTIPATQYGLPIYFFLKFWWKTSSKIPAKLCYFRVVYSMHCYKTVMYSANKLYQ